MSAPEEENASEGKFGAAFEAANALSNTEVSLLLSKFEAGKREINADYTPHPMFAKAKAYADRFSTLRNQETAQQVRELLVQHELTPYELGAGACARGLMGGGLMDGWLDGWVLCLDGGFNGWAGRCVAGCGACVVGSTTTQLCMDACRPCQHQPSPPSAAPLTPTPLLRSLTLHFLACPAAAPHHPHAPRPQSPT